MSTHQALVLTSTSTPLSLQTLPIPTAASGSVVVKVLGTYILPYISSVLNGKLPYHITLPLIPGASCIGRIHSLGPDAVSLQPGQLVYCDITIRARDDPDAAILMGLHGGAAPKLMEGDWRDGCFSEYAKFPLENVFRLDEEALCKESGYTVEDLCSIPSFLVPFGGLSEIDVGPGDTVIVAPATGRFGGAAVTVALALGATVVAAGRNATTLSSISQAFGHTGRIRTVQLSGVVEADTKALKAAAGNSGKGADAYIDFSPPEAVGSTHIEACIKALRTKGRAALMGGIWGKVQIDYQAVMLGSLRIQGRFMYEREGVERFIRMVEKGNLKVGAKDTGIQTVGRYKLQEIEEALVTAEKESGWGKQVLLIP